MLGGGGGGDEVDGPAAVAGWVSSTSIGVGEVDIGDPWRGGSLEACGMRIPRKKQTE